MDRRELLDAPNGSNLLGEVGCQLSVSGGPKGDTMFHHGHRASG